MLLLKILLIVAIVFLCLFVLSFVIYFFNLDMKMMAAVQPLLSRIYDKRKRERKL